jgi:hypothetical protein
LFVPIENESADNYNHIIVRYNDEQLEDQLASYSSRTITIRAINDAPTLKMGEIILGGEGSPEETVSLTVGLESVVSLNLNVEDIDAGDQANMAFRVAVIRSNPTTPGEFITFNLPNNTNIPCTIVRPIAANPLGYFQFNAAQAQANVFLHAISFTFPLGDFDLEIVAHDKGYVGHCVDGFVVDTRTYISPDIRATFGKNGQLFNDGENIFPNRCNRVTSAVIKITSSSSTSVIATVPAAVGASVAALAAIGAVIYAKMRKPKDMDAWTALDGAMGGNMMTSGIHVEAGSKVVNTLYQGAK